MIVNLPRMGSGVRNVFGASPLSSGSPAGRMDVLRSNISQVGRAVQQKTASQTSRISVKA